MENPHNLFLWGDILTFICITIVYSEDADSIRIHTLSATGDIESIQKMVDDLEHGPSSST